MAKYVILCGSVYSGNGKGLAISSIAKLMQMRGQTVNIMKLESYGNSSVSSLRPGEHGEAFIVQTTQGGGVHGAAADLDLGTYERFLNIKMTQNNIWTTGMLYKELMDRQEKGEWLGDTIQVVPHLVNLIQEKVENLDKKAEVIFVEIGGTVGDIESSHFYEWLRRFKNKYRNDVAICVLAPIVRTSVAKEPKTKPIQNGIKQINSYGIHPDLLICRTDSDPVPEQIFDKISDMTGITREAIFIAPDVDSIYKIPLVYHKQNIDDYVADLLHLPRKPCRIHKYREMINKLDEDLPVVRIGIIGKYSHGDAYLSIKESLTHASLANDAKAEVLFISTEEVEKSDDLSKLFDGLHGLIIPGGFSLRGCDGKINTVKYARENNVPLLGICLGLQMMFLDYCRNILGIKDANSQEFDVDTKNPVVHYLEGQKGNKNGGDMRLGVYDCKIVMKDSLSYNLYKKRMNDNVVLEKHRHRLEINSQYLKEDGDLKVTGINPQTGLVEIMEYEKGFMIGCQFHPEFTSSLTDPAPLFVGLVKAAMDYKDKK